MSLPPPPASEYNGTPWWDREQLRGALIDANGNQTAVAARWGVHFQTISEWVDRHDLEAYANTVEYRGGDP